LEKKKSNERPVLEARTRGMFGMFNPTGIFLRHLALVKTYIQYQGILKRGRAYTKFRSPWLLMMLQPLETKIYKKIITHNTEDRLFMPYLSKSKAGNTNA
jgi:hypothetical protein